FLCNLIGAIRRAPVISLNNVSMDEEELMSASCFLHLLLKLNPVSILVKRTKFEVCKMFNQEFIELFVHLNLQIGPILTVEIKEDEIEMCRFYPSQTIIAVLSRFQSIKLLSLTLPPEWIFDLLMMRSDKGCKGSFEFSISGTVDMHSFRSLENSEIYEVENGFVILRIHTIGRDIALTTRGQAAPYTFKATF
ncbi:hypothetical protein PFISCL1PPCAC_3062, partial [Pristionchus fissidentatus]